MKEPIVYVVDDEVDVRESISIFLEISGIETRMCDGSASLFQAINLDHPGVVLLDLEMPITNGLEIQERLVSKGIRMPVIFLSGHGNIASAVSGMREGAIDFLQKPIEPEALLVAIRKTLAIAYEYAEEEERANQLRKLFARLTPREEQIVLFLSKGYTAKEIGKALTISHRTAEIHRTRIIEKLDVDGIAELVALYLEFMAVTDAQKSSTA
jgi:RNA polymerase sigma factor (sigma-70 family)